MKALLTVILIAAVSITLCGTISAEVPHMISYQGRLTDDVGSPLNGNFDISFKLFPNEITDAHLWKETHLDVLVSNGLFNVLLGSTTPLESDIFDGATLWLGIAVGDEPMMPQRIAIVSTGYALRADEADHATHSVYADTADYFGGSEISGWQHEGNRVFLLDDDDSVGIGTSTPGAKLHLNGNILLQTDSDIIFGDHQTRLNGASGDLLIEAADDIWLQPEDVIYIRPGGGTSWGIINPVIEEIGFGTVSPDELLHIENDADGGRAFFQIEASHPTNWHEAGLRIKTPQNTWHLRMDDDTNNNIPEGALGLRSQFGVESMTWSQDGKVGIGVTDPQQKLHVAGDALIDGDVIADNIEPAPGVASNYVIDVPLALGSTFQSITSREITVPGPGYVVATGNCSVYMDHGITGSTQAHVGLSTSATGPVAGYQANFILGSNVAAGRFELPASCQAVFSVASAGSYTYHLIADSTGLNPVFIYTGEIVLMYVPEAYGTVRQ